MVTLTWKFSNGHEWSKEFESVTGLMLHMHINGLMMHPDIVELSSKKDNVIVFYKRA
jgi:hypothetical protein